MGGIPICDEMVYLLLLPVILYLNLILQLVDRILQILVLLLDLVQLILGLLLLFNLLGLLLSKTSSRAPYEIALSVSVRSDEHERSDDD